MKTYKRGDRISFRVVNYKSDQTIDEETDEFLDGIVRGYEGESLIVGVSGYELPFRVEPKYIQD